MTDNPVIVGAVHITNEGKQTSKFNLNYLPWYVNKSARDAIVDLAIEHCIVIMQHKGVNVEIGCYEIPRLEKVSVYCKKNIDGSCFILIMGDSPKTHILETLFTYVTPCNIYKLDLADMLSQASRLDRIKADIDDTFDIMHKNIESLLKRGENIDDLVKRSDTLKDSSKLFYRKTSSMNRCCSIL